MLRALTADAVFIAALFVELAAALSILQSTHAIVPREEFEPVLAFYRTQAVPILGFGANLAWSGAPQWFADASILAAVFFFLFFIAQAKNAVAPYGEAGTQRYNKSASERIEAAIDWALPVAICALGALALAPTLLPLLTLPAALFLAARKAAGRSSWFEVSRSFYVNALVLGVAAGAILALQR